MAFFPLALLVLAGLVGWLIIELIRAPVTGPDLSNLDRLDGRTDPEGDR